MVLTHSRDSSRFPRPRRLFIYSNCHTPSGQSRVYRVITQLRTDSVHCRESAGTGSVGSPQGRSSNGCCCLCITMDQLMCASLNNCCRLSTASASATKRTNHAPTGFDQRVLQVSQGHARHAEINKENCRTEVHGGGGLELVKPAREPASNRLLSPVHPRI